MISNCINIHEPKLAVVVTIVAMCISTPWLPGGGVRYASQPGTGQEGGRATESHTPHCPRIQSELHSHLQHLYIHTHNTTNFARATYKTHLLFSLEIVSLCSASTSFCDREGQTLYTRDDGSSSLKRGRGCRRYSLISLQIWPPSAGQQQNCLHAVLPEL